MSTPWQETLGDRIRHYRIEQGFKLRELAQLANMYWIELDRYERAEQMPDLNKLYMLAKHLEISIHDLLPEHDDAATA